MGIGMKFGFKNWPWASKTRKALSFVLRFLVDCIDTIAGWMESRVFQVIRILLTLGIAWFLVRTTAVHSAGPGLMPGELAQYGRAAVMVAAVAAGISILWSASFCDGPAGILMFFIDSPDDRPLQEDPMDKLDRLVRAGRIVRARWLCKRMIRRREGSRTALETLLSHLSERRKGAPAAVERPRRISGGK